MIEDVVSELSEAIDKSKGALQRELGKLRTGRAHPGMLDSIKVDYYGALTPLSQMATVSVPEARLLTVKPWDRSAMQLVEKAIRDGGLGLNPQPDNDIIRVPVPPLSEERRKELVKLAKKHGEECKVAVRKARHDAIDTINSFKKDGDLPEDDAERGKKRVEETVAAAGSWVDEHISSKEKEILQV